MACLPQQGPSTGSPGGPETRPEASSCCPEDTGGGGGGGGGGNQSGKSYHTCVVASCADVMLTFI